MVHRGGGGSWCCDSLIGVTIYYTLTNANVDELIYRRPSFLVIKDRLVARSKSRHL